MKLKWVEKYAPKSLDDVLGNAKAKKQIEDWAKKWSEGNIQKPLLLMGPPGIGKTTIAHLVGKEYFSETIELNASDKRSYNILKETIGEASQTRSLFNSDYKLIIMDEVDGINGRDDSGGVRAITQTIKDSKQPIIMMANDPYSKRLSSIKGKCIAIKFSKIHTNSINAHLKRICDNEGVTYDPDAIKKLSKQSDGDLRSAISSLQAAVDENNCITMDDVSVVSKKDTEENVFDAVRTILKSKNPEHIREAMQVDAQPNFLIELIAENIPREYERVDEIAKAYENIALADINLGRALKRQDYSYWKYAFAYMSRGVAASKKETYKKFTKYTNSTVYSRLSKARKKENLKESVTSKMSVRLHTSPKELEKQLPYYKILFEDNDTAYDLKEYFRLTDDEVKLFRSRKIPASVEKKKLKELRKQQEQEQKEYEERMKKSEESSDSGKSTKKTSVENKKKTTEKKTSKKKTSDKKTSKKETSNKKSSNISDKEAKTTKKATKTTDKENKKTSKTSKDTKKTNNSTKDSTKKTKDTSKDSTKKTNDSKKDSKDSTTSSKKSNSKTNKSTKESKSTTKTSKESKNENKESTNESTKKSTSKTTKNTEKTEDKEFKTQEETKESSDDKQSKTDSDEISDENKSKSRQTTLFDF